MDSLHADSPDASALRLLQRASIFQLDVQQRSLHAQHSANILQMASVDPKRPPITRPLLACYPAITPNDIALDPLWKFAPIVVVNNAIRHQINAARLKEHAKQEGLPIIFWNNNLSGKNASSLSASEVFHLYKHHPALSSYYVAGTPCFLRDNISTEKGIVNGAPCVAHSLTLDPEEHDERRRRNEEALCLHRARRAAGSSSEQDTAMMDDQDGEDFKEPWPPLTEALRNAAPGEMIQLALPPLSINVQLQEPRLSHFAATDTLVQKTAIVPIPVSKYERYEDVHPSELLRRNRDPIRSVAYQTHGVEPGFAITFHKVRAPAPFLPACTALY